ncbi:hypothetical protein [Streptomyces sp. NPDC054804]
MTGKDVTAHELQEMMTAAIDRRGLPLRPRFRRGNEDRYLTGDGHAFARRAFC